MHTTVAVAARSATSASPPDNISAPAVTHRLQVRGKGARVGCHRTPSPCSANMNTRLLSRDVRDEVRAGTAPAPEPDASREPATTIGTFRLHPRGFGFCELDDTTSVFVPPPLVESAVDGDTVDIDIDVDNDRGPTATRLTVVTRQRTQLTGIATRTANQWLLHPDPHCATVTMVLADAPDTVAGNIVVADITGSFDRPAARYRATLGAPTDPRTLTAAVEHRHHLAPDPVTHDNDVRFPGVADRVDVTDLPTVTIDAASTTDIDDAVSATVDADGNTTVWVHIADVGEVVPPGSPAAREAARYAHSCYLPTRTRHMLPRTLSETECSLLPDVERNTITVQFAVTATGEVRDPNVFESRIRSDQRCTYRAVQQHFEGRPLTGPAATVVDAATVAATALTDERRRRGGLTGDTSTARRIVLSGSSTEIVDDAVDAEAYALIERLMVAANEAVAAWAATRQLHVPYRNHRPPDTTQVDELGDWARNVRVRFRRPATPRNVAATRTTLERRCRTQARGWSTLVSRAVGSAAYDTTADGHFALASDNYLHFTSPIRRFADLVVHWAVKAELRGVDPSTVGDVETHVRACDQGRRRTTQLERQTQRTLWVHHLCVNDIGPVQATVVDVTARHAKIRLDDSGLTTVIRLRDLAAGRWRLVDNWTAATTGRQVTVGTQLLVDVVDGDPLAAECTVRPARTGRTGRTARRAHRDRH